jgi:hypothetical protein
MIFKVTGRPGIAPGRLFFAFARKGVLMAFCGLLLFGGIGVPSPMRRAVCGVFAGSAAVLWHSVLVWRAAALFFLA